MDRRLIGVISGRAGILLIGLLLLLVRLLVAIAGHGCYQCRRRRFHQHHGSTAADGDRRRRDDRRSVVDHRAAAPQHLICDSINQPLEKMSTSIPILYTPTIFSALLYIHLNTKSIPKIKPKLLLDNPSS